MTSFASCMYLSGAVSAKLAEHAHRDDLGILVTPDTAAMAKHIPTFGPFGLDNGCFNHGDKFDAPRWLAWLDTCSRSALFAVAPDVVGDHEATVVRSAEYLPLIRSMGFAAAWVGQNGATVDNVPWSTFDVLFIGGVPECLPCGYTRPAKAFDVKACPACGRKLTEWKLSEVARSLITEARRRGMWVHVGRVNSGIRFDWCVDAGANSADGTFIKFGPTENVPRLLSWLDKAAATPSLFAA